VRPRADVREQDGKYTIEIELPGVRKEEVVVRVSTDGKCIEVEGMTGKEAGNEAEGDEEQVPVEIERVLVRGTTFARTIRLPRRVNIGSSEAWMKDGVLTIKLEKAEPEGT
ncbi:HSP20-like chaperone, partial [Vararia minispora EC-137]